MWYGQWTKERVSVRGLIKSYFWQLNMKSYAGKETISPEMMSYEVLNSLEK